MTILTYSTDTSESSKSNSFYGKITDDTLGTLAATALSQSQLLMQRGSTIGNQKLSLDSEGSSTLDPFYYLDPELEEYLQLSLCHDFIGDEASAGFFGTNGYTGKGITVAVMNGAVAYNASYFSKGHNSLIKSVVVTDIYGDYRAPDCPDDYNDHGTGCASLVKQVAPESNIISIWSSCNNPRKVGP